MNAPPAELKTARLLLRVPTLADTDAIFEEYAADTEVTRYVTWMPHSSKETVSAFLGERIERHRTGQEYSWAITLRGDARPIGMIAARVRDNKVDIGYVLGRAYWNRGYMTEAISVVTEWMLRQPGIFRVWAVCDIENIGSARVLEKCQFEREGVLHRWIVHPNQSSEPRDCYVYGRVR